VRFTIVAWIALLAAVGCEKPQAPPSTPAPGASKPSHPQPQETEEEFVAAIQKLGGTANTLGGRFTGSLDLGGKKLTAADLKHFKDRDLQIVNLSDTDIGDEGLDNLANVEVLDLSGTKVTNEGLKAFQHAPRMISLDVRRTAVSSIENLSGAPRLKRIDLDATKITDDGLKPAGSFPALDALGLTDTKITDAGLKHLKSASKLTVLGLRRTQVTDAGIAELKQSLPKLFVDH
jgi:Leucine-rich repeat (LRR) protein